MPTKGCIEMEIVEDVYVNAAAESKREDVVKGRKIAVYPMCGEAYNVPIDVLTLVDIPGFKR